METKAWGARVTAGRSQTWRMQSKSMTPEGSFQTRPVTSSTISVVPMRWRT